MILKFTKFARTTETDTDSLSLTAWYGQRAWQKGVLGALGKIRENRQLAADGQQPPFYRWRRIAAIFCIVIEAFPFPFGVARLARIPSTRCLILLVGLESVRHGSSRGGTCESQRENSSRSDSLKQWNIHQFLLIHIRGAHFENGPSHRFSLYYGFLLHFNVFLHSSKTI